MQGQPLEVLGAGEIDAEILDWRRVATDRPAWIRSALEYFSMAYLNTLRWNSRHFH